MLELVRKLLVYSSKSNLFSYLANTTNELLYMNTFNEYRNFMIRVQRTELEHTQGKI